MPPRRSLGWLLGAAIRKWTGMGWPGLLGLWWWWLFMGLLLGPVTACVQGVVGVEGRGQRAEATSPGSVLDPFSATLGPAALFGPWFPEFILHKHPGRSGGQELGCDFRGNSSSDGPKRQTRRPRLGEGCGQPAGAQGRGELRGREKPLALNLRSAWWSHGAAIRGRAELRGQPWGA